MLNTVEDFARSLFAIRDAHPYRTHFAYRVGDGFEGEGEWIALMGTRKGHYSDDDMLIDRWEPVLSREDWEQTFAQDFNHVKGAEQEN